VEEKKSTEIILVIANEKIIVQTRIPKGVVSLVYMFKIRRNVFIFE